MLKGLSFNFIFYHDYILLSFTILFVFYYPATSSHWGLNRIKNWIDDDDFIGVKYITT